MKDTTKKELKDVMEILGCVALSCAMVFGVNSRLSQCTRANAAQIKKSEQVIAKPDTITAARDSIMMLNKTRTR